MSQVIYRKYRSRNFEELFGQEHIKHTLKYAIQNNNVAHAYLFSGPRGTGKTSTARIFAKAVNCTQSKDGNPCNKCDSCKSIDNGSTLDVIEIDAASNRGIEEVRDLRQKVNFAPSSSKYKVYIIDEVHMLTKEAFNALLKTLEEPPSHIIFILATTEVEKMPITVISRTQRYDFQLASPEEISKKIEYIVQSEDRKLEKEAIDLLVTLGKGSFRDTETILEKVLTSIPQSSSKKGKGITEDEVEQVLGIASAGLIDKFTKSLLEYDSEASFKILNDSEKGGINSKYFLNQVLENLRKKLLNKAVSNKGEFSLKELVNLISIFLEANSIMRYTPIDFLPIEIALAKVFDRGGNPNVVQKNTQSIKEKSAKELKPEEADVKLEKQVSEDKEEFDPVNIVVTLNDILNKWSNVIEGIRPFNHHLVAFLSKSQPFEVIQDKLMLKVAYKFHKQRIEQDTSRKALIKVMKNIFGVPIRIECIIDEVMKNTEMDDNIPIDSNEDIVEEIFSEDGD